MINAVSIFIQQGELLSDKRLEGKMLAFFFLVFYQSFKSILKNGYHSI